MPVYPKLIKQGVFWVSVSKWGKLIKLAQKEENSGSFGGKVQTKLRKKSTFNKHTVFNNHTGWIFSPKIINVRYLISTYGLDFGPEKLNVHCTTIRYCRVCNYIICFFKQSWPRHPLNQGEFWCFMIEFFSWNC